MCIFAPQLLSCTYSAWGKANSSAVQPYTYIWENLNTTKFNGGSKAELNLKLRLTPLTSGARSKCARYRIVKSCRLRRYLWISSTYASAFPTQKITTTCEEHGLTVVENIMNCCSWSYPSQTTPSEKMSSTSLNITCDMAKFPPPRRWGPRITSLLFPTDKAD